LTLEVYFNPIEYATFEQFRLTGYGNVNGLSAARLGSVRFNAYSGFRYTTSGDYYSSGFKDFMIDIYKDGNLIDKLATEGDVYEKECLGIIKYADFNNYVVIAECGIKLDGDSFYMYVLFAGDVTPPPPPPQTPRLTQSGQSVPC